RIHLPPVLEPSFRDKDRSLGWILPEAELCRLGKKLKIGLALLWRFFGVTAQRSADEVGAGLNCRIDRFDSIAVEHRKPPGVMDSPYHLNKRWWPFAQCAVECDYLALRVQQLIYFALCGCD